MAEIDPVVLEKKIFLNRHFHNFVTILFWKRAEPFFGTNLNPLHQRLLCAKFGWNWPSGSGEEDLYYNVLMCFSNFIIISPWKRIGPSFEITRIPFTQGYFEPSLVKLSKGFWRRRFFKFINVFSPFCNYLPLEKGGALHLNKLESPSTKSTLCQVWLKLAQWFWRRRWKCEKFTTRTTTTT